MLVKLLLHEDEVGVGTVLVRLSLCEDKVGVGGDVVLSRTSVGSYLV